MIYDFFLIIRPPPKSTLFPYTTLFRSAPRSSRRRSDTTTSGSSPKSSDQSSRSEEHTSELQSHVNLVCRLLLEKKKNKYEPKLSDDNSHNDKSVHVLLNPTYQPGVRIY